MSRRAWLAMSAAATGAVAAGASPTRERVRLSLNENGWGPSSRVAPALRAAAIGAERYVEQSEVDALTRQIAKLEQVAPEQVVIGEVLEALGLYLARQRRGGGGIVFSAPGYTALVDAAAPLGGRGVPVPLDTRLANDLPALTAAIDDETLALSLVNPHNPSGTVNDPAAFHAFVTASARRTLVVVDEAYLEYDDLAARSAIRHVRADANVLVFRTLAKIYGLAGLSIGYAVAPLALAQGLRTAGIGAPHSLSRPSLLAAGAALADQRHVEQVRAGVAAERQRLHQVLDSLGVPHTDACANFVFFRPRAAGLLRTAFATAGIEIARPFPPLDDWVRITIGRPAENDRVIEVLREAAGAGG